MTIYVKCDECDKTEEFTDGYGFPSGWHTIDWNGIRSRIIREKHFCDSCWKKMKEEEE